VAKDANYFGSYDLLAEVNIALSRWNRAEWCARKSLEIDPLNSAALLLLASTAAKQKNEQAALEYYVRILQTEPTNAEAQKKIMGIVGGFPLWAIPALIPIGWVALICLHVNGFAALGASLVGTFTLVPILYRYFPKVLLYPQPACWRLPAAYRVFVVRTWKDNWKTHSLNTMCVTCFLIVIIVFVLAIAAGRFV
jgi:tetratricopeptide (TPR) repeat protein